MLMDLLHSLKVKGNPTNNISQLIQSDQDSIHGMEKCRHSFLNGQCLALPRKKGKNYWKAG